LVELIFQHYRSILKLITKIWSTEILGNNQYSSLDQNEEDRQVRIQLLDSAGSESKKKQQQKQKVQKKDNKIQYRPQSASVAIAIIDEDEEEKAKRLSQDPRLLFTLIGQPTTDDPLTNVVGVYAPWVTLNNYKYNVKVLPGSFDVQAAS
ncbi:unnamed protein product, partial [Rotaria sordida]